MSTENADLTHRFAYHAPRDSATVRAHETVRERHRELAADLAALLPADRPREIALALTKLEESMMWANAAIARSEIGVTSG